MSASFRVERSKGFTIMSNYHLRDKGLSLKARGLLSYMLSLPEDWDYSISGLAAASGAGRSTVMATLKELERAGYIERQRLRNEDGTLGGTEYIVREQPREASEQPGQQQEGQPKSESQKAKNGGVEPFPPKSGFPTLDNPTLENPTQAYIDNNKELKTKRTKDLSIYPSSLEEVRELVNSEWLSQDYARERVEGVCSLLWSVFSQQGGTVNIRGQPFPAWVVQDKFLRLEPEHIAYVFDSLDEQTRPIRNPRAYLLSALCSAPDTYGEHVQNEFNVGAARAAPNRR